MGGGTSMVYSDIEYKEDRGGVYWIKKHHQQRDYEWGDPKTEVSTYISGNRLEAHLVGKDTVSVSVKGQILTLEHVEMHSKGRCTLNVFRCIFAAIRSNSVFFQCPIVTGTVEIDSNNGISAYHCYMEAFKRNGFEAVKDPKIQSDIVSGVTITFRKIINNVPKLVF
jgi:hypothetical protein|tara:strand:+ start:356 stop:856 length:501 start_codon:yes stop_codon:yes gene_type:complete